MTGGQISLRKRPRQLLTLLIPLVFVEETAAGEVPCPPTEEAAFGASAGSPEEEPFDALDLLRPIEPKEEEDVPIEDILEELARPDEVLEPALEPEASVEDQSETDRLASEIETNNSALNTETIEESLAALDLEPKEEVDFEAEQEPVAEVAETPVEASVEASGPVATEVASSSSATFSSGFCTAF